MIDFKSVENCIRITEMSGFDNIANVASRELNYLVKLSEWALKVHEYLDDDDHESIHCDSIAVTELNKLIRDYNP